MPANRASTSSSELTRRTRTISVTRSRTGRWLAEATKKMINSEVMGNISRDRVQAIPR
jgi:hypothetical protein